MVNRHITCKLAHGNDSKIFRDDTGDRLLAFHLCHESKCASCELMLVANQETQY
jgi:hypothetical protein